MNPCSCNFKSILLSEKMNNGFYESVIIKKCSHCRLIKIEYWGVDINGTKEEIKERVIYDDKEIEIYNKLFEMK